MAFKDRNVDPPVDLPDKEDGCSKSCLATVIIMWIIAIIMGFQGLGWVVRTLGMGR